jgi:endonuclease VIII
VVDGDGIHRAAAALRTALVGRPISSFVAPTLEGPAPAIGRIVERVESHGRNLEIVWDDGLILHTNLRLSGTWHLYRHGERWRRPGPQMRVEVQTVDWIAVCFNAPIVETYREFDRYRHPGFGPHGPDLSRPDADLDESINRLYHYHDQLAPVSEALLDQHVANGIGNVYRCEVLWACGVHPFAPVSALDADDCSHLITTAAALLRSKLCHSPRITASITQPGSFVRGDLAVYGRNGQRCARCGDTVQVCQLADHDRLLYWCPGCQLHRSLDSIEHLDEDSIREMDPHPAAAKFLSNLPWRRNHPLAG